ncbi:hypothetical protein D3C81_2267090 [compost metagenome]
MNPKDAYIRQLENTIQNLQNQVNNLTEMVLLLGKKSLALPVRKLLKGKSPDSFLFLMKQK